MSVSINWRRIVAEGVVIVVSILLAFGIDAWWDQRQAGQGERLLLAGLEADLLATIESLDAVIERHEVFSERAKELSVMSEAQIRALDRAAVDRYERALGQYMTFEPRGGTLGGLASAEQLSAIRDLRLRGMITEWFQLLEDSEEEARFLTNTAELYLLRQSRLVDVTQPTSGDDLFELTQDPELMAFARAKLFFGTLYRNDLRRLKAQGDSVVTVLQGRVR